MKSEYIGNGIEKPLYEYCINATNREGDMFVGIKSEMIDNKQNVSIHFPIGYNISRNERKVRTEIIQLLNILQKYGDTQSIMTNISKKQSMTMRNFPIQAYTTVIFYYLNNGVYKIKEDNFTSRTSGHVNWYKTIRQEQGIITQNGVLYSKFRVRIHNDTDKNLISEINAFCVYESYVKLGWLYNLPELPRPHQTQSRTVYKEYLNALHSRTYKDRDRLLYQAMLDILEFSEMADTPEKFYFGTNNFEYIWEKLIQSTYGNEQKRYYFPKTQWRLHSGKEQENTALEPDTIMRHHKDIYVLDAKYYKYGITNIARDLPASSSINKQISYGEYIVTHNKFSSEIANGMKVYNAFLMPYDASAIQYNQCDKYFSIGEAVADWKLSENSHERVQGILIDVKHLMNNQVTPNKNEIIKLSEIIVASLEENNNK